jgi:serine/threonine-protein kinase
MSSTDQRFGPYRILGKLGAGGMGEVFLARDPRLERDVVLKMLPAEVADDAERMARFRHEALALAAVNHPNIATIFGFEESEEGVLALVLERVEGVTLAERLRQGAMPQSEALRVCAQIAEALEAAHARGVIHRDLKPQNVMLAPSGWARHPRARGARVEVGRSGSKIATRSCCTAATRRAVMEKSRALPDT